MANRPLPGFHVDAATAMSLHGVNVPVEEMVRFLGEPSQRDTTITDMDGVQHVLRTSRICAHCSAGYGVNPPFPEGGKLCAACRQVYYCNKDHQRANWKLHKPHCMRMRISGDAAKVCAPAHMHLHLPCAHTRAYPHTCTHAHTVTYTHAYTDTCTHAQALRKERDKSSSGVVGAGGASGSAAAAS